MRSVLWTDRAGREHRSLVRDGDPDSQAPYGIPQDPPDLNQLDWEGIKIEIHNRLVKAGLVTWMDVQRGQNRITGIIQAVLKRKIVRLYRQQQLEEERNA